MEDLLSDGDKGFMLIFDIGYGFVDDFIVGVLRKILDVLILDKPGGDVMVCSFRVDFGNGIFIFLTENKECKFIFELLIVRNKDYKAKKLIRQ